jgi:hypothetical protein
MHYTCVGLSCIPAGDWSCPWCVKKATPTTKEVPFPLNPHPSVITSVQTQPSKNLSFHHDAQGTKILAEFKKRYGSIGNDDAQTIKTEQGNNVVERNSCLSKKTRFSDGTFIVFFFSKSEIGCQCSEMPCNDNVLNCRSTRFYN